MKNLMLLIGTIALLSHGLKAQETKEKRKAAKANRVPTVLATLLRGPYLQVASSNGIMIRWRTNTMTRGVVTYGTIEGKPDLSAEDSSLAFDHKVRLSGLSPHTKYYYTIGGGMGDTLQAGADNFFVTLPPPGEEGSYRIGAFGDCGNNSPSQRNIRDQVTKYLGNRPMDSWILLGDNAYVGGSDPEYQEKFFNVYKDNFLKNYPLFPAPGNHDYNDLYRFKNTAQSTHDVAYYQNFSVPENGESGGIPSHSASFYSYDIGNIHFLSLDSYGKEDLESRLYDTLGAQVQWVKKDLDAFGNRPRSWVIAYWHHPPYTMGSHNSDKDSDLMKIRENFIRILERYGVDLIICGHSHLYERSRLMKGYYGLETEFDSTKYDLTSSSALYDGSKNSCPYIKEASNQGTIYVVSGSAGALGGRQAAFPHNAMYYSNNDIGGASMIEVEGNKLELKWICSDGKIRDHFVMMKDVNKRNVIKVKKGETVTLTASFPGTYKWNKSKQTGRSIQITPSAGKTVYEVSDPYTCLKDVFEVNASR